MVNEIFRFFSGSYRITLFSNHPEAFLDLFLDKNLPVWNIQRKEGALVFSVSSYRKKYLFSILNKEARRTAKVEKEGVLVLLERFGKRFGLYLGFALFLFLSFFSGKVIWSVEVVGNRMIDQWTVCEKMAECGVKTGTLIEKIDPMEFSLDFQVKNPEFSFASLNIVGTRAVLTVREREAVEKEEKGKDAPANLVSSIEGEILRLEVFSGQSAVKRGDLVKKGDLLVSGVVENKNGTFRVTRAEGRVFAKTSRYFEVSVPYSEANFVLTGRETEKKRYEILGFTFGARDFDACEFEGCKRSENTERLSLFGKNLPILCHTATFYETEEKNKSFTVDRAVNLAYDKYEEYKRGTLLPDFEILSENAVLTEGEKGVTLSVELVLSEDIAKSLPFSYQAN